MTVNALDPHRRRYAGIEAARAVAAIAVVISHVALITAEPRYFGVMPFNGVLKPLAAGVDFFFVLSGFIITTVHWNDIGYPDRLGRYARRRFLRIFPLFWTVLVPLIVIYQIRPSFGIPSQHALSNVILSFFLLPNPDMPVLGVAWTLTYEVFFYLMFGLGIAFGRNWIKVLVAWGVAIITANLACPDMGFPFSFFLNVRNLEFLTGVACALYLRAHTTPWPAAVLAAGIAAFAAGVAFVPDITDPQQVQEVFTLVFGSASALTLLGLIGVERAGWFKLCEPAFIAAGACSYAIYLAHPVADSIFVRAAMWFSHRLSIETIAIGLSVVCVGCGVATHYLLEQPVTSFAKHALDHIAAFAGRRSRAIAKRRKVQKEGPSDWATQEPPATGYLKP